MSKTREGSCKQCLYDTSHPFGIVLDDDGICSGCRVHHEKDTLDWTHRLERLKQLVEPYRSRVGNHDCIVHIDSSAESFYTVHLVKNILGLEPLLVNFNSHYLNDIGVRNLAQLRTVFDCDLIQYTVDLNLYKKLVRHSLVKFKHVLWPYIAGKTALPVQIAVRRRIPLVIWGGLQTVEQVGMFSHEDEVEMSRWYRRTHDLFGIDEENFIESGDLIDSRDLDAVTYPEDADIAQVGVRGIYLSNYFRWDPWEQNTFVKTLGFKPEEHVRSYDPFEYAGCSVFMGIHDLSRQVRRGYGKVLDQACRDIRFGRLKRDRAAQLVEEYGARTPGGVDRFWDFLGISQTGRGWMDEFMFNTPTRPPQSVELPRWASADRSDAVAAQQGFLTFGKGIHLPPR